MPRGSDTHGARDGASNGADATRRHFLRALGLLTLLAVVSRLVWVHAIHPPGEAVFSDMARYLERAQALAAGREAAHDRHLAWQAWGTHTLMAVVVRLGSDEAPFRILASLWALMSAAVVPLTSLLCLRVWGRERLAVGAGVLALLWFPHLSAAGFFSSETPFMLANLLATWSLLRTWQEGKGAAVTGICCAFAFAIRPQVALFFVGVVATFALTHHAARRGAAVAPRAGARAFGVIAACLLATLAFSMLRFERHAGYFGGVAENANMNFTAGRCHNIVTQAFPDQAAKARADERDDDFSGRRVSLPAFRMLASTGAGHPLALRPAMGEESLRFVGEVGDPAVHRELRAQCYARTGWLEQLRYSLVNVSLLWVLNHQWPEAAQRKQFPIVGWLSIVSGWIFALVFWIPSTVAALRALGRRGGTEPGAKLCALQLVTIWVLAAVFFGSLRLRMPYDPYAWILAFPLLDAGIQRLRARVLGADRVRPRSGG